MSVNISVDSDKLDSQMSVLNSAIDEVPDFDDPMELSSMGNMISQAKYKELAEKMKRLMTSYKQLLENSVLKAHLTAKRYGDMDQVMSQQLLNGLTDIGNIYPPGEN